MDDETRLTPTEARGGSKGGYMRVVLVVSLVLIVVAFATIYLGFA